MLPKYENLCRKIVTLQMLLLSQYLRDFPQDRSKKYIQIDFLLREGIRFLPYLYDEWQTLTDTYTEHSAYLSYETESIFSQSFRKSKYFFCTLFQ